jgi:hypothetical protein
MSTTDQDYRGGVLTSKEVPGSVEQYARALEYERGEVLRAIDEIDRLKRELDKAREANRLAIHTGLMQEALIADLRASQEATGSRPNGDAQDFRDAVRRLTEWLELPHENGGIQLDYVSDSFMDAWGNADALLEQPHEPSEDARDAARYRWLRYHQQWSANDPMTHKALEIAVEVRGSDWDRAIDQAMRSVTKADRP